MKKFLVYTIFLFIGLFVISSCIESLHKLYTPEDLVFKEMLVGYWKQPNGAKWIFREDQNTGYDLTHINQKGDTTKLDAHVLKLDSYHFLDMKLAEKSVSGITSVHLVPAHTFSRIRFPESDSVIIKMFSSPWIKEQIEEDNISVEHTYYGDDNILITASTNRLQELVVEYAEESDAYLKPWNLERVH